MKVKIKFFDVWEQITGVRELEVELKEGLTAGELLDYVVSQFKTENCEGLLETIFISSGSGEYRTIEKSEIITDGSTILFSGPVIGG